MSEPLVVREIDVEAETWSDPVRGELAFRSLLGDDGPRGDFTAGVAELAPGGWLGRHRHDPAEIYFVLSGEGTVEIDGEQHPISAGTAVSVPADTEHGVRNTGSGTLRFFYVFAVGSFHEIEYRFSADQVNGG